MLYLKILGHETQQKSGCYDYYEQTYDQVQSSPDIYFDIYQYDHGYINSGDFADNDTDDSIDLDCDNEISDIFTDSQENIFFYPEIISSPTFDPLAVLAFIRG